MTSERDLPAALEPSLLRHFADALWPRENYARVILLLVIFRACSFWIISAAQHPHEPPSVMSMYRVADTGDIGYLPVISALSKFNFGECTILEDKGSRVTSFAFASIAPYSALFRIFGWTGLVIGDVLVTLIYYATLFALLRAMRIPPFAAYVTSLLVVSGTWLILRHLPLGDSVAFWDLRIPRPIVTDLFMAFCLYAIVAILNRARSLSHKPESGWTQWLGFGISFAALLQGEIYLAMSIAAVIGLLIVYLLIREIGRPERLRALMAGIAVFCVSTAFFSIPFVLQRVFENKDASRRLGVIVFGRKTLLLLPGVKPYLLVLGVILLGVVYLRSQRGRAKLTSPDGRTENVCVMMAMCLSSLIAMPISILVLGKGIQLYHFDDAVGRLCSLAALVIGVFLFLDVVIPSLKARYAGLPLDFEKSRVFTWGILGLLSVGTFGIMTLLAHSRSARTTHIRADFPEYAALSNYRAEFADLTRELKSSKYDQDLVLGTFDHQVYCWWVTFHDGYSLVPDPFFTTLSDAEIEHRLMSMCKTVGLDGEQFSDLLDRRYINALWLGHCKYALSKAHTFSPLSDYPEDVQALYQKTSILDAGSVIAIPIPEHQRLSAEFASLPDGHERLDVIVLTNDKDWANHVPRSGYREVFHNEMFRVFQHETGRP